MKEITKEISLRLSEELDQAITQKAVELGVSKKDLIIFTLHQSVDQGIR